MTLPLGAVALKSVRMYLPLVRGGLPQMPRNSGPDGLEFAKNGFRSLMASGFAPLDLRVGAAFEAKTLDAFGTIAVLGHVWRAMQLLSNDASVRDPLLQHEPVTALG